MNKNTDCLAASSKCSALPVYNKYMQIFADTDMILIHTVKGVYQLRICQEHYFQVKHHCNIYFPLEFLSPTPHEFGTQC